MKNILYIIILSFLFSFSVFSEDGVKKLFDVEKKSAEQGNVKGQFNLGWMYNNGLGVTQDYKEAANRDHFNPDLVW
jgi:TPR repeat protein